MADEHQIKDLEKHLERSKEYKEYSQRRLDVLVITLATLGLGYNGQMFMAITCCHSFGFLELSTIAYVLTLVANLVSQITGYYANASAENIATDKLQLARYEDVYCKPEFQEKKNRINEKIEKIRKKRDRLNVFTDWLNNGSVVVLFFGLIFLLLHLIL